MIIEFDKAYLSELYYTGHASDKKHRFQPQIVRKYVKIVDIMESVSRIEDLFRYNSLRYEALSGDKAGTESVAINDQYRLEFSSRKEGGDVVVTICRLLELSKHYR
jgi:proteic killer suppression protein